MGVVLAGLVAYRLDEKLDLSKAMGGLATSNVMSLVGYVVLLALPLYWVGRRMSTKAE